MSNDKPREWWITNNGYYASDIKCEDCDIHVIEYSAYKRMQAEFVRTRFVIDIFSEWNKILGNPDKPGDAILDLIKERDELKLLAENYSAILQKLVDRHWFDGTQIENHYLACSLCDCGNSGEKINTDGHDYDCAISLARQALVEKERE